MPRLLDAAAAADMLTWENSGFSVDASVRITLIDRDVPSYFQSLEHLLRYCARPHKKPFSDRAHRHHDVSLAHHDDDCASGASSQHPEPARPAQALQR